MRDVLAELLAVWEADGTAGVGHRRPHVRVRPTTARARRWWWRPMAPSAVRCPAAASRAPFMSWPMTLCGKARRGWSATGSSDDDAFSVGLTCGGIIDVFVEPVSRDHLPRAEAVADDIAGTSAGRGRHGDRPRRRRLGGTQAGGRTRLGRRHAGHEPVPMPPSPTTPQACWPRVAARCSPTAPTASAAARAWRCSWPAIAPRPRMLVFGAIDFAAALARQGSLLGYRVTVCDARPVFATLRDFPPPTRSSSNGPTATWPHSTTRARSTRARSSACSPTTRSSTFRCSRWRCGSPRSATWARWGHGVPTMTGWPDCVRRA